MSAKAKRGFFSINPEYSKYIHGILLAFIIYIFADAISKFIGIQILGLKKTPISNVMVSIVLGLIISNVYNIGDIFKPGIGYCLKFILRLGIIFLGIRLSFSDILTYGSLSIPLVIICIVSALLIIKLLIKFLKISSKMAYLIAIGTAICGITAIVAVAPIINAKKEEVSYATANITLFGILAIFIYPFFVHYYFPNDPQFAGMFIGTAIHDTSQVAGAGLVYDQLYSDPRVLEVATITKLVRNTFLIFLIPIVAFIYNRDNKNKKKNYSLSKVFPLFVIGFIAMVAFRTVGDELFLLGDGYSFVRESFLGDDIFIVDKAWADLIDVIKNSSSIFLSMAMASLGLSSKLSSLRDLGIKPMIVGLVTALTVGVVSIVSLELFQKLYFVYLLN